MGHVLTSFPIFRFDKFEKIHSYKFKASQVEVQFTTIDLRSNKYSKVEFS